MQIVAGAISDALERAWGAPVLVHRSSPVVTVHDNYEVLGYPPAAPAREARYTRYVDGGRLLRTHMTAAVPGALRALAGDGQPDLVVACPGLVYRRDVVDRLHVGEPHQLDLWRVRRGEPLTTGDLDEMIGLVVSATLPGAPHRALPASHPYTTEGREVEVETGGRWVELLECGLAGTHVLEAGGLDPGEWSGLALGLGLDRALMLRKGVTDIRLLRSTDPRVAGQMLDLEPYRPVSAMPPTRRDLSIAVAEDLTAEELGDRIRERVEPARSKRSRSSRSSPRPLRRSSRLRRSRGSGFGPGRRTCSSGSCFATRRGRSRPRRRTARATTSTRRSTRATSTSGRDAA